MKRTTAAFRRRLAALAIVFAVGCAYALDWLRTGFEWVVMFGSTAPAFGSTPATGFTPGSLTAANTATDGTGTTLLIAQAPSITGGGTVVESIRCMHLGTNVATVVRVFLNNGSSPGTGGNNALIAEKTMPANTLSQTAESVPQDIVLNQVLKGHATTPERIYVTIGTAVAAGIKFTPRGGDL